MTRRSRVLGAALAGCAGLLWGLPVRAGPGLDPAPRTGLVRTSVPRLLADPDADRVVATADEVRGLNARLAAASGGAVADLAAAADGMAGDALRSLLVAWDLRGRVPWREGRPVPAPEVAAIQDNRATDAVGPGNPVRRAVAVRLSSVRHWPSARGLFESPGDRHFDLLQATTVNPGEPVVLLHRSRDGAWWFARTALCDGWLPARDVGELAAADWARLLDPPEFVVVTAPLLRLPAPGGGGRLALPMGTRLARTIDARGRPRVLLPRRRADGTAVLTPGRLPAGADVRDGFVPWTRANVLRLARRHLGRPYGWGGAGGRVDCSGLVIGLYRCFGLQLPRNSGVQAAMPGATDLASVPPEARDAAVAALPAGSLLHLPGHVMVLLGRDADGPVVFHALAARGGSRSATGEVRRVPVMRVVASGLSLVRASGVPLRDALTSAHDLESLARP